jgi:DNA-directed RNA polymerase specialized sigma24 family protein
VEKKSLEPVYGVPALADFSNGLVAPIKEHHMTTNASISHRPPGSVTSWIGALRSGETDEAPRRLWEHYFPRLVALARVRLRAASRGPDDEEDVAICAFESLCRGVAEGRFDRLRGREEVWRLLATITARKVAHRIERERRQKRGGGRLRREADLGDRPGEGPPRGLDSFAAAGPDPVSMAVMGERVRGLFGRLPEESLRLIALLRLEGYSNGEIACCLDCAVRSVERKLERIRLLWAGEGGSA